MSGLDTHYCSISLKCLTIFVVGKATFSISLIEGIQYAGIEDLYKEAGNTHILLTNSALNSGDNCFWKKNPVMLPGATEAAAATAWEQYDKKVVKELLTYHIVRGEWSYFNIDSSDRWIGKELNISGRLWINSQIVIFTLLSAFFASYSSLL